jgi:membrane fusion protein (multidrug efflux system)
MIRVIAFVGVALASASCLAGYPVVLEPSTKATFSSEIGATIAKYSLREGDSVERGQILIQFDCRLHNAEVERVNSDLDRAQARHDNMKRLESLKSASHLDVVLAEADLKQAKAEAKIAKLNQRRCSIRAPWPGVIAKSQVNQYEMVSVGAPLFKLIRLDTLEGRISLPSAALKSLSVGDAVTVYIAEIDTQIPTTIARIGVEIDPVSETVEVSVAIPEGLGALPGMSGSATLEIPVTEG